ncbi:MAG TPA: CAP domain-containing protein [Candidatus Woesebacteria bacterium]|nr:CAP domain-containing protein [Candidatus Woesebacteria bacterium]
MANAFISLFAPHPHNNHKAKVLWPKSIVVLIGLFIMGRSIIDITVGLQPGVLGYASQIDPDKIIELTNSERLNAGLSILKENAQLDQAALAKAMDMFEHDYWAHISPTGTEPWYFINSSGYSYQHAGENLARDFSNPTDVVRAWMASPTHKQNLLDGRYQDIGVAVVDGTINGVETTLVVQMFGSTQTSVSQIASSKITNTAYAEDTVTTQTIADTTLQTASITEQSVLSPLDLSRAWSLAFVILILFALSLDWLFVLRYNIIRISGKNWAHLTYFAGIAIIILIIRQGIVL